MSQRHKNWLAESQTFLDGFEGWLVGWTNSKGDPLSESNCRSVMRGVEQLFSGLGVAERRWEAGVRFRFNDPVTNTTDMVALKIAAKQAVKAQARYIDEGAGPIWYSGDTSNGWVADHPIKKLIMYKEYLRSL